MPVLNQAAIDASNQARDDFLHRIDSASGGNTRALRPEFYGDSFFDSVESQLGKAVPLTRDPLVAPSGAWGWAGWFNYFAGEAQTVPLRDKGRLLALVLDLDAVLERSGKGLKMRGGTATPLPLSQRMERLVETQPKGAPLGVLKYLMEHGFEARSTVPASSSKMNVVGNNNVKTSHLFGNAFGLQAAVKGAPLERDAMDGYLLYYRGDTRPPATVIQQGGAKCRADLSDWVKHNHVKSDWHPWQDDAERGKMWLRKGNGDNDYYTVNSIGMDFHISCAYPMFQLGKVDPKFTGHVADWDDQKRLELAKTGKAECRLAKNLKRGGVEEWALVDKSRVYLCVFPADTPLSPTYDMGNNYPEAGVRNVPLNQIVAWFEIDRYHNNDDLRQTGPLPAGYYASNGVGGTMTIHVTRWGWLDRDGEGKNILGLASPSVLANRLNSYLGRTFEITHDALVSPNGGVYLPSNKRVAPHVKPLVKPAVLKR